MASCKGACCNYIKIYATYVCNLHGILMLVGIVPVDFISGGSRTSIKSTSGRFGKFSISSNVAMLIFNDYRRKFPLFSKRDNPMYLSIVTVS